MSSTVAFPGMHDVLSKLQGDVIDLQARVQELEDRERLVKPNEKLEELAASVAELRQRLKRVDQGRVVNIDCKHDTERR